MSALDLSDLPNVVPGALAPIDVASLAGTDGPTHPPAFSYSTAAIRGPQPMKAQIDWIPLAPIGGIRPTQGKTLALMQVCGGSQSFNTVNQMRVLGRWMRMLTIPNQSSVPAAWKQFEKGRMKPSSLYNRIVDVMEELAHFTVMARGRPDLVDRYSERVESLEAVHKRVSS